jgi:purine nucleosidase
MPRSLLLLLLALTLTLPAAAQKRLVIIDQDADGPGDSSMESMLMLLNDPGVQVLGITIESGDGWQRECTAHALRMLELVHRTEIPVFSGATFPLVNSQAASRRWESLYGHWGYKGAWTETWPSDNTVARIAPHGPEVVPPLREGMPTMSAQTESATNFLLRAVHEHPNQITIIALGPVTNLALAARLDDHFASLTKELVFMGGGFSPDMDQAGEFTSQILDSPRMSFNMRWDPEAATIVLHAPWPHITLVTEDSSQNVLFTHDLMQKIAASSTPSAQYIAKFGSDKFPMWDDIAAAVFLDPSLVTRKREVAVDVDLDRGANYGATLSWTAEKQPRLGEPIVTAVLGVDAARTRDLFLKEITH